MIISFLPSIYTHKSVSLIDAQKGPDVQQVELCVTFNNNLCGKRIQKRTDTLYVYVITESGGCTLAASKNCKLTILQHSFSMTLKKTIGKKAMPNLFPITSLIWAAIPSLEPEQACVSCLGWGGLRQSKFLKRWVTL